MRMKKLIGDDTLAAALSEKLQSQVNPQSAAQHKMTDRRDSARARAPAGY